MDAKRATEMVIQAVEHLANLEHEDAAIRVAALQAIGQRAGELAASVDADLQARITAALSAAAPEQPEQDQTAEDA